MLDFTAVGIDRAEKAFGKQLVDRAMTSTLNKVASKASTAVNRQIRDKYAVKARDLRRRGTSNRNGISVRRARVNHQEAIILGGGKPLPLIRFRVTPRTPEADRRRKRGRGVRYQVVKGRRVRVRSAFVARMDSGHVGVFQREESSRLPIRELFGPSVPQMLEERASLDAIFQSARAEAPRIFDHELRYRVQRAAGTAAGPSR